MFLSFIQTLQKQGLKNHHSNSPPYFVERIRAAGPDTSRGPTIRAGSSIA